MDEYQVFFKAKCIEYQKNKVDISREEMMIEISEMWEQYKRENDSKNINGNEQLYFQIFDFLLTKQQKEYERQQLDSINYPASQPCYQKKKKIQAPTIQISYCTSEPKFVIEARNLAMEILREFKVNIIKSQIHHSSKNISVVLYQETKNIELWSYLRDGPIDYTKIFNLISKYVQRL
ncbi:unnamed protein product [Paramecium pentaurelia]|uniref:Uncharacterized protein n=1 Tax=Paramecium pentaurelia TaxID=43138 RepID=A0A8S1VGH2_9CILI|nr:unnamed protein product [Paramecium pentaurelia]